MRNVLTITILAIVLPIIIISCQKDYIEDFNDIETESIVFEGITASRDSANMFDTIILTAVAKGENLQYKWQRAKGTLIPFNDDPSKAYFWGCPTCIGESLFLAPYQTKVDNTRRRKTSIFFLILVVIRLNIMSLQKNNQFYEKSINSIVPPRLACKRIILPMLRRGQSDKYRKWRVNGEKRKAPLVARL